MAVFVDISETKHLTFSPLNDKHNVLYHRARHNVNERHVQKPWFDLSPFLDKVDDKGLNLDDYRPENDIGIQPLQSLSIVEDYFSDKPLMAKEFKIGDFWDFLFSSNWGDGYSIRVLEGRLYNLIMSTLVNLTLARSVRQHSTVAYAKNRRRKYSIYKHSEKKSELCSYEETLLLEFIYYGHSLRFLEDTSSCGYPKMTEFSTLTFNCGLSSDLESTEQEASSKTSPRHSRHSGGRRSHSGSSDTSSTHSSQLLKKRSKSRITSESVDFSKPPIDRSLSRVQEAESAFRTPNLGINRNQTISNFSSGSEDYSKPVVNEVDLAKFACTERVSYLGEFDLSDDSSCPSSDDEVRSDYGQEFYLGEKKDIRNSKMSTEEILRARKSAYRKRAERRRNELQGCKVEHKPKPIFPEFSELDVNKYVTEDIESTKVGDVQKFPDEIPDLFEIIDILKRDEREEMIRKRLESRYKNPRKRASMMIKMSNARFADEVGGVTDSQACRLHCYQKDSSWKLMSDFGRKKFLKEKALQFAGKSKGKIRRGSRMLPSVKSELVIPLIFITAPSGVTFLHAVSRELMNKRYEERKRLESRSSTRRRSSLVSTTTPLCQELLKLRQHGTSITDYLNFEDISAEKEKAPLFPKAVSYVSGMESPDFDSDEEDDELGNSQFNSKKLNVKYSFERIQKKKAQKKKANPTQQTIFKILKKYYRMQSILRAFSGPTAGRRRSSVSAGRGSISSLLPRRKTPQRRQKDAHLPTIEDESKNPKIEVGKLKWFPFLDAKRELHMPTDDMDEPLFENYPMEKFRENLEKALDEFVVRREVVISDYTAKASVSITFTKKSVFSNSKMAL